MNELAMTADEQLIVAVGKIVEPLAFRDAPYNIGTLKEIEAQAKSARDWEASTRAKAEKIIALVREAQNAS